MRLAQSYQAELEQKEGLVRRRKAGGSRTGSRNRPEGVVVGSGRDWSEIEWERAYAMWQQHGNDYALVLSPERLEEFEKIAARSEQLQSSADNPDDRDIRRAYQQAASAAPVLPEQPHRRPTSRSSSSTAEVERLPETVHASQAALAGGSAHAKLATPLKAIRLYKDGLDSVEADS